MCIRLFCFRVGYFVGVYQVLDFMAEAGTVVGVMAFFVGGSGNIGLG